MANEIRQRQVGIGGLVEDAAMTATSTLLTSAGLSGITGGVDSSHHMAVVIGPDGDLYPPEVAYITSLSAGAGATGSTGLLRAQEGSLGQAWPQGTPWIHTTTVRDMVRTRTVTIARTGNKDITSGTRAPIDATNLPFLSVNAYVGDILEAVLTCETYVTGSQAGSFDMEVDLPVSANLYIASADYAGLGVIITNRTPLIARGRYVVTEAGSHGVRPVAWFPGSVSGAVRFCNDATASSFDDALITFTVTNYGAPSD